MVGRSQPEGGRGSTFQDRLRFGGKLRVSAAVFAFFLAIVFFGHLFYEPPAMKSGVPGYASVHYCLSLLYKGARCAHFEAAEGREVAPGLLECSGDGNSLRIKNSRNGTWLDIRQKFKLDAYDSNPGQAVVVDQRNSYLFLIDDEMIVDFWRLSGEQMQKLRQEKVVDIYGEETALIPR